MSEMSERSPVLRTGTGMGRPEFGYLLITYLPYLLLTYRLRRYPSTGDPHHSMHIAHACCGIATATPPAPSTRTIMSSPTTFNGSRGAHR